MNEGLNKMKGISFLMKTARFCEVELLCCRNYWVSRIFETCVWGIELNQSKNVNSCMKYILLRKVEAEEKDGTLTTVRYNLFLAPPS